MRMNRLGAILAAVIGLAPPAFAETTRVDQILARFEHANQWRDHVMIVAHRGGWMEGGAIVHPENSFEGIASAVELGVEMVEIDVRKSKDGEYVVMHDSWLDRTTNCKGEVELRTVADLKQCRLVVEGTGRVTAESVPTLAEMLAFTRDKVLVNIDNKLDVEDLAGMVAVARDMDMEGQVVIKQNLWNAEKIAEMKGTVATIGDGVKFMPIIADDAVTDTRFLETASKSFSADAVEMINWHKAGEAMTDTGGALFSTRARPGATGTCGSTPIRSSTRPAAIFPAVAATSWRCWPTCPVRHSASGSTAARQLSRPTNPGPRSNGSRPTAIASPTT